MSKDKLLYSYLGAWNSNILNYSKLFPKSLILHKRKRAIINDGILYGGVGGIPVVFGNSVGTAGYWTGNSDDVTEYYEGLSVIYVKGINGATTTYLNINNLGNIEVFKNNIKIGNEHSIGSPILLTYINGKWQTTDINTNDVNLTKEATITNSSYYLTFVQEKEGFQTTYTTSSLYYQGDTLFTSYISGKLKNSISLWGQDCDFSTDINGDISDTGDILPKEDVSYNIGSGSLRYNNVYGQRFVGRADTVASSQDNTTKFYFVGVTGANQSLKYDNTIYTTNNTGNLFAKRIYLGNTAPAENTTYNLYVAGKGYISSDFTADKFITKNYDNSYVLLAGGNVKKIDTFGDGVYLPLIGGTVTGDIYYKDSNNTSYLYLNEKNSGLFVGGNGNLTSNAAISTNGNVYLTLKSGNTYFKHNIVGGTGVSVTSDINGKISITNTLPHKPQHLYIGLVDVNANAVATSPYIKLFDDTTLSHQYQIKGSGSTTVTSDANGNITISSTDTNTDTHWTSGLKLGVKDALTNAATTNGNTYLKLIENGQVRDTQIKVVGSGIVTVTSDAAGVLTINGTALTSQYTTHLYVGAVDTNANGAVTNPYLKLFDDTTLRHQYQVKAGNGISVESDANGNLTITNTKPDVNHDTHWTSYLRVGAKDATTTAATSNGATYLKLIENGSVRADQILIKGTGVVSVSSDANGVITINGTALTSQYTTHLYVGTVDTNANGAVSNPYLKLFDDTTIRHQYQIKGSGATTVSSDANGNIIISSTDTNTDTDTHWTSGLKLGAINTTTNAATSNGATYLKLIENGQVRDTQIKVVGSGIVSVTSDAAGVLTINGTAITSHYTTHLYVGAVDTNANGALSNPYIKLFDDTTIRHQYQIKGSGATTVSSDANGNITISSTDTNTDTHWTSGLKLGAINTTTNAATTNGNTYLKLIENGTVRDTQIKVVGSGIVSVTSDAAGVLTINGTAITSHYTTHLYVGTVDTNANTALSNPYIKLFDDTTLRHQYQIKGSGATIVSSDANGNITISSTDTNTNTHFTTGLYVGAKDAKSNAVTTNGNSWIKLFDDNTLRNQYNIVGTGIVTVTTDANGKITINGTALTSHYTTHLYVGAVDTNANGALSNPYIKLFDDTTIRHQYQIKGSGATTVSSDANGNITISSTDTNTDTHWTSYLRVGAKNATTTAATSNGATYLKLIENGSVRADQILIKGTGVVSVSSDANGVITINGTALTSHYTTHLYVGAVDTNANGAVTNPYLKLFDDTTLRHQYQIKGSGGTTVSSDANGHITISSSTTSHTHQIKINNTAYTIPYTGSVDCGWYIEKLAWWTSGSGQNVNDITSGTTFVYTNHGAPTTGTIAVFSSRNNSYQLQIQSSYSSRGNFYYRSKNGDNGTWLDWTRVIDAANYTSYIDYHLYIGAANSNSNAAVTNPYIKLYNLTTNKYQYQVKGGTGITVASDANGNITITNTAPDTDTKVTQNSNSDNAEYRLLFKYSANDTNETTTVKYNTKFRYNPSTGNIFNNGNFYIDTGDTDRFIQFRYNSNNYAGAAWRLISRGSGSGDTNYFDIETGGSDASTNTWYRVIRLTMDNRRVGIGIDSPSDKLDVGGYIRSSANSRYLQIGPQNTSWAHYNTNADTGHWFNKRVDVDGDIRLYNGNGYLLSTGQMYAKGYHYLGNDNNNYVLTAGGSYKQWTTGNTANALVARDGNGYIFGAYFNSAISDENITIGSVYIRNTSDNYIRRISFTNFMTQVNSADIVSFTKSLKVTQNWIDADIAVNTTNFPKGNGAYAVLIDATSLSDGTDLWPSIYSGVMTIYTSGTNATGSDEVILHRAGHASAKRLYLRTTQNNSGNYKIQVAASNDFSVAKSLVFKFRKLI